MNFAIDMFHCTELGKSVLTGTQITEELSNDEQLALALIYKYHYEIAQKNDTKFLEKRFQQVYGQVNLTRLVILKLLTFEGSSFEYATLSEEGKLTESKKENTARRQPPNLQNLNPKNLKLKILRLISSQKKRASVQTKVRSWVTL